MQDQKDTIKRSPHDRENPYVMISKQMLQDKCLSPKTKGILCYLLSLPNDWTVHPRQIAEALDVNKQQVYTAFDEMIANGYATKETIRGEKGQFDWVKYEFYEFKILNTVPEKRTGHLSGKPDTVKRALLNNNLTEKETTNQKDPEVVVFSDLSISEGIKKSIINKYSEEDISQAVIRVKNWADRTSDEAAILTCLKRKDTWNDGVVDETDINKEYAKNILPKKGCAFELLNKAFEIYFPTSQRQPIHVEWSDPKFKEKVKEFINEN